MRDTAEGVAFRLFCQTAGETKGFFSCQPSGEQFAGDGAIAQGQH